MSRTFEPNNLVHLPNLDARAAQAVGSAVLAAAANKTLPDPVAEALAEVKAAVDALEATAMNRLSSGDTLAARSADSDLDAAWNALHGLLRSLTRVSDRPRADQATTMLGDLFPDGLRFTRLRFELEWVESQNRLKMIDERTFAPQIEQLGGATLLAQLRQAHAHYGEVLSIITARAPENGISVREAWSAVMRALRQFVVRVTATIRSQDPGSADLAHELLAPIETWEATAPTKAATDQPPAATPPPPAAPPPGVAPAPVVTPSAAPADPATGMGGANAGGPGSAH
jgi:hypothetical protein